MASKAFKLHLVVFLLLYKDNSTSMVVELHGSESTGMLRDPWVMQIFTLTLSKQRNLSGEISHKQKILSTNMNCSTFLTE